MRHMPLLWGQIFIKREVVNSHHHQQRGLIIAPAWVGDAVMSQALLKFLVQQQNGLMIDVAVPASLVPLFERMPEVNQIIALPFKHGQLRPQHYSTAWVLPNSWKSALVPFFAQIKQRIGWRGEMRYGLLNDIRQLDKSHFPLMVERFIALGWTQERWQSWSDQTTKSAATDMPFIERYPDLLPSLEVFEQQRQNSCQQLNFTPHDRPLLALCPGAAFGPSKRWLPEYFGKVACHYLDQGIDIAILGSPEDQHAAEIIMTATQHRCHNWVGKTTLAQAIDLLSLADIVVTNDSGLLHIACALDCSVVAIYGSSSPTFTPPLSRAVTICHLDIACSPCFERHCPLKHFRCMRDLLPQQVIAAIDQHYQMKPSQG
jgi:heptosyltransferase-2